MIRRILFRQTLVSQCCFGGLVMALSLGLSLISEFHHGLFGVGFRMIDNSLIIVCLPLMGLGVDLIVGGLMPWVHLSIDGDHSPMETMYWFVVNLVSVLLVYFLYFRFKMRRSPAPVASTSFYQKYKAMEIAWVMLLFLLFYVVEVSAFTGVMVVFLNPTIARQLVRSFLPIPLVLGLFAVKYALALGLFLYISPRLSSMMNN